ncbi:hypothetical protein DdX_13550 [Ditylenchus destructor]|uniref:Uncharacterized protein n=1 Tax=Ditylenchus destructor TaxID=166010 RepID=A0AAD4R2Q2_9BILA|nr:hypothetical protein DdX_13550 [Ditylenchus destructor]
MLECGGDRQGSQENSLSAIIRLQAIRGGTGDGLKERFLVRVGLGVTWEVVGGRQDDELQDRVSSSGLRSSDTYKTPFGEVHIEVRCCI